MDCLYRYDSHLVSAGVDEFDNPVGPPTVEIYLSTYKVLRETPKGAWIRYWNDSGKRFVLLTARKRFACRTPEEAKESFIARKRKQIRILSARIANAEQAIFKINNPLYGYLTRGDCPQ